MTRGISTADIIDRVLDKGIVIDYEARISVGGIDTLMTVDARCVVASIQTYLDHGGWLVKSWDGGLLPTSPEERRSPRRRR